MKVYSIDDIEIVPRQAEPPWQTTTHSNSQPVGDFPPKLELKKSRSHHKLGHPM